MEEEHVLEFLKAMQKGLETQMAEMKAGQAKAEADRNEMLERLEAKLESNQVKTDVTLKDGRRDDDGLPRTTEACQEMKEACQESKELSPEEMESEVERRKVPMECAVVKPIGGRKKRHRGQRMAAGRRGKPKELT
jgi:hypothetical protein